VTGPCAYSTDGTLVIRRTARSAVTASRDDRFDRHHAVEGVRGYASLMREALSAWTDHRASSMGAAVAFYATFSMAPILVIAIAIAGSVFGPEAARGEVIQQFDGLMGKGGAETIQSLLAGAYRSNLSGFISVTAISPRLSALQARSS
jgi:uncharacterized BrkB/YihY/UPF0761 family membrane protein